MSTVERNGKLFEKTVLGSVPSNPSASGCLITSKMADGSGYEVSMWKCLGSTPETKAKREALVEQKARQRARLAEQRVKKVEEHLLKRKEKLAEQQKVIEAKLKKN